MFVALGYRILGLLRGRLRLCRRFTRRLNGLFCLWVAASISGANPSTLSAALIARAAASSAGLLNKVIGTFTSLSPFCPGRDLTPLSEPTVSRDSTLFDSALTASKTWAISDSVSAISNPSLYQFINLAVTAGRQALATYLLDKRTLLGGDLQDSTAPG